MSRRTTECYTNVFKYIEKKFNLEPDGFITDFEQSMRNAIKKVYPNTVLRGCWYHFCAALRKKHLKLGMFKLLKENDLAKQLKKMLMSLPLLPEENFNEGYKHIKSCAENWALTKDFEQIFKYFEQYWFRQVIQVVYAYSNLFLVFMVLIEMCIFMFMFL